MTKRFAAVLFTTLAAPAAFATSPNTTAANSVPYEVGQGYVTHYFDENTTTRWFRFGEIGGHSYCVEAVQGPVSPIQLDPNVTVYTDATGASVLSVNGVAQTNDNGAGDPYQIKGSRTCYIAPTGFGTVTVRGIKVNVPLTVGSGDAGYVKFRIVDTTLVAAYIVSQCSSDSSSGCSAFSDYTLSNSTTSSIGLRIGLPNAGNAGSSSTVAAGGVVAANFAIPNDQTNQGAMHVAHNGPPNSIRGYASVTTLVQDFSVSNGGYIQKKIAVEFRPIP